MRPTKRGAPAPPRGAGVALSELFSSAPVPMFILDSAGVVVEANSSFADLLGHVGPASALGVACRDFWHGDDLERLEEALAWILSGDSDRLRTPCKWVDMEGAAMWVRLHLSVAGETGRERVFGVAEECTEELWAAGFIEFA